MALERYRKGDEDAGESLTFTLRADGVEGVSSIEDSKSL